MRQRFPWLSKAARLLSLAAVVSANVPLVARAAAPTSAPPLPTWSGPLQPQERDERGLWMLSNDDEQLLKSSRFLITDRALNDYVRGVLCKTVGQDRCGAVRLYIMRVPAFNASMSPNGMMQIWSGALLRMHSEAELAAVLGHEFAHYEQRHSLAGFKQARSASDAAVWMSFIPIAGLALSLGALQGYFQYNQQQETAADLGGFAFLEQAGYRTGAFANVWERLISEDDAARVARGQKAKGGRRSGFFATHPASADRMAYLRALATKAGDRGDEGAADYRAGLGPWAGQFIADQLKLNDFGGTEWLLADMAKTAGWTADLLTARGDLYRLRGLPGDMAAAAGFYREALTKGDANPETRRGLGLALLRQGQQAEGATLLKSYLDLKPDASDAAMLRMMAGLPTTSTGPDK
jgi:predicted Zn-dependent protease